MADWHDHAIVLASRAHGETGSITTLLTRDHGRHAGHVPGGRGKVARAALQAGNTLAVRWKARLPEQLGQFTFETERALGSNWLHDAPRLSGIVAACAMAEATLPEREPHADVYDGLQALFDGLGEALWPALYIQWECGLLAALGFGLDLGACAVTGQQTDLIYVSPRSGRAVSREAGEEYRDKLLSLPQFMVGGGTVAVEDVRAGFALTGHFLERHVLGPHGKALPAARVRLVERLQAGQETRPSED